MLRVFATFLLALAMITPSLAQMTGRIGGHVTAAEVADLRPGTVVALTGYFIKRHQGEYYRFRDDTGEIIVEVERRVWGNREIGPHMQVRIFGEVERSLFVGRHVEVKRLVVMDPAAHLQPFGGSDLR